MTLTIRIEPTLAALVQREAAAMNVGADKLIQQALVDYLTSRPLSLVRMPLTSSSDERVILY